jgi:hypothetical protein
MMTAQEAYFSDFATYATFANLQAANNFSLSTGNAMAVTPAASGYTGVSTNASISAGFKTCTVQVGAGAGTTVDGVTTCS